jgi:hypothetical protein
MEIERWDGFSVTNASLVVLLLAVSSFSASAGLNDGLIAFYQMPSGNPLRGPEPSRCLQKAKGRQRASPRPLRPRTK